MPRKTLNMLRRAAGMPPGYVARRGLRELRRRLHARRLRRELCDFASGDLARITGCASLRLFLRQAAGPDFLYSEAEREELRRLYLGPRSSARAALQAAAAKILAHEFDLLGSGPIRLGGEIDWHMDFKSGRRWDLAPSHRIDYAELDRPSDVKVAWELSRCHHFVTLGQAWLVDRDARAAREFESQALSWIRANPAGCGIHWACTMEVGLRAVNWVWALALFADAPLGDQCVDAVLPALYRHGRWIPENLEIARINGNHYIADALGLVACGALFRAVSEGRSWLDLGARILEEEIRLQAGDDGVDIEASVPYHRLALEIFLTGARLLEAAGRNVSPIYREKLEAMIDFVHAYTPPDGLAPVIGDNDDGRVCVFGNANLRDHRYLLSTGCTLFGRDEWKVRSGRFWEDSLWLLGPAALETCERPGTKPDCVSRSFPVSGFHVLRSPRQYVFVDAGPVGFKGLGGHGHNDCLSFEWHADGRPLLTDSGLFVYTASPAWRDRFRSTEFHNGIRVDGEEINRFPTPPSLWLLGNDAEPIDVRFRSEAGKVILHAGHTGYRRLKDPVTVFRTFEMDRDAAVLRLTDRIEGAEEHRIEFFFHAAPGAAIRFPDRAAAQFQWPDGFGFRLECENRPDPAFAQKEGWFAPAYGVKLSRPVCVVSVLARLPIEMVWRLEVS